MMVQPPSQLRPVGKEWTTLDPIERRTEQQLRQISGEIAWYEEEARKSVGLALQYKLEIGKRLASAKILMAHGEFLAWAQQEFGWTARHVQNHLMLAANAKRVSCLAPGASLRMALAAIKESQAEPSKVTTAVEEFPPIQRVHLIGEIEEGTLDCETFVAEVARLAATLGAPKTRWKTR
jgi:hypothetical protein